MVVRESVQSASLVGVPQTFDAGIRGVKGLCKGLMKKESKKLRYSVDVFRLRCYTLKVIKVRVR